MRDLRRTCEDGHALIWHREWVCPLCATLEKLKKQEEAFESMANSVFNSAFRVEFGDD